LRRELAEKYNAELVEVREDWRHYLERHDLKIGDLLVDRIHHNPHGGELWGALQARHFKVQPANPKDWEDRISRFDLREALPGFLRFDPSDWTAGKDGLNSGKEGAALTIPFEGSRLDVISRHGNAWAEIRVDGKKPSELPGNWAATLPSSTPIDYRPAIMRVMLHGKPVKEKWTVTVESCSDDGKHFSYSVRGSVSGEQDRGDHTGVFHSRNGVIELRPEWFTLDHAIQIRNEPILAPFEISWEVYPMVPDVWEPGPVRDNPSGQTTLVQCLPAGAHELVIKPMQGEINIEELLIYRNDPQLE
jgi:hypothetical protein